MVYYDTIAPAYQELYKEEQMEKIREILNLVDIKKDDLVLDLGCGSGFLEPFIKGYYIGLDISKELLRKIKGNKLLGDAKQLPFRDKSFDWIFCITVLQDIEDKAQVLREIKRVGKRSVITIFKRNYTREQILDLFKQADLKINKFKELVKDFLILC